MPLIDPDRLSSAERLFLSKALTVCYFTAENENGEDEYYFVALTGDKVEAFNALLANPKVPLEKVTELGRIVATGLVPLTDDVKDWVRDNYCFNPDWIEEIFPAETD